MSNDYVDKVSAVGTIYDIHVPNGTIDRAMLDTDLQEKTDAVNDLKSAITGMTTATASDEGKALKAKTVSGGKVTEWEFGDTGSQVVIDPMLSHAGEAADAKATGDAVSALNNFGSETTQTDVTSDCTTGKYYLTNGAIGSVVSTDTYNNVNFNCIYFAVSAGDQIILTGTGGQSQRLWCFTDSSYKILSQADEKAVLSNATLTALANGYVFINVKNNFTRSIIKSVSTVISLHDMMDAKLDKNQGATNSGKILGVSNDGTVAPIDNIQIDNTLTHAGEAADAKKTGEEIEQCIVAVYDETSSTYTNTGTSETPVNYKWGFYINESVYSLTFTPDFLTSASGQVTVTRWYYNGTWSNGVVATLLDTKQMTVGQSVTFYNITPHDFIAFEVTSTSKMHYLNSSESANYPNQMGSINGENKYNAVNNAKFAGIFAITNRVEKVASKADNPLIGKKLTLIGDSLTHHNTTALINWPMYLVYWCGCTIQNLGASGEGFSSYAAKISNIASDTDIIGIAASINGSTGTIGTVDDTSTDNTLLGYANSFFNALITAFPNKPIVCYVEARGINANNVKFAPETEKAKTYIDGVKTLCEKYSIPYDLSMFYEGSVLKPWIAANQTLYFTHDDPDGQTYGESDGIHPNSLGHKVIAQRLIGIFEGNIIR